jgi:hypothetical protein
MTDGFAAEAEQIRGHATSVDAVQQRFQALKAASANITEDHAAYGMLCGWISAVLEGRHAKQDDLFAYVERNLSLASDALVRTGQDYERVDDDAATRLRKAGGL